MADQPRTVTIDDPNKEYSPADYQMMQAAIAAQQARAEAARQQLRAEYLAALAPIVSSAAFAEIQTAFATLAANTQADDNLSFHVASARLALERLASGVTSMATMGAPTGTPLA